MYYIIIIKYELLHFLTVYLKLHQGIKYKLLKTSPCGRCQTIVDIKVEMVSY